MYPTPNVAIRDFFATSDLDKNYNDATFSLEVSVKNYGKVKSVPKVLQAEIAGKQLKGEIPSIDAGEEHVLKLSAVIESPRKWTAETPNLYPLILSLNEGDQTEQLTGTEFGFRKIEIDGNRILLNGQLFKQKGVNRVEHDPVHGHYISKERLEQELKLMKKNNINSIRTAHFPFNSEFYVLCNRYGLYVMNEANLEGTPWVTPLDFVNHESWREAHVERMERLMHRDKNRPSVITWSVGNESHFGENMAAMHHVAKKMDTTRPTSYHYQQEPAPYDIIAGGTLKGGKSRYYTLEEWEALGEANLAKPYVRTEGAHGMGNAMGTFVQIVDIMEKYENLGGFYIWDWVDQGIKTATKDGVEYIGYGGDFGEQTHSYNFCLNGVVMADLSETGKLAEVKYGYKNAAFEWTNNKKQIRITNKNYFVNLSKYSGKWELLRNGNVVQKGDFLVPDIAPQEGAIIPTPVNVSMLNKTDEWLLNLQLQTTQDELWAPKGYSVVEEQLSISSYNFSKKVNVASPRLVSKPGKDNVILISDKSFSVEFDSEKGSLKNYKYNGEVLFEKGPSLNFWRATTDNDYGNRLKNMPNRFGVKWYKAGLNNLTHKLSSLKTVGNKIIAHYKILADQNNGFNAIVIYSFYKDGSINFDFELEAFGSSIRELSSLPKVGTQWVLPKPMENMEWYGKGPFHNYIDRASGSFLGNYSARVEEQFVNYPYPQENGNKMEVRWVTMDNGNGLGLKIHAQQPLEVSAHNYTTKNMEVATHTYELLPTENIYWNIDYKQCGLGNGSCGPNTRKEHSILPTEKYQFNYWMQPIIIAKKYD